METDWNKLIELYLSGELSTEGKEAFEKELFYNSDLQDELFTHRSIQQAAQRAHQRDLVLKASSNYYFQKKVNYIILSTLILLTAITLTYFLLKKSDVKRESTVELTLEKDQETPSSEKNTQQASIGNEKSGNQEFGIPEISSDNSMNYLNAEKNGSNLLTKTKNNTLSVWNFNTNSIISNFNDESEKTTIVSIENLSQSERDLEKDESLDLVIANDKVAFSDTVIPVVGGGKVAESFSFTTTDDISTKSVLKKSTRSLMINSVIYVPEGSFLIVSEKKNDPVLVRNKFDNTDQIQEIGGMSFPKEKLVRKKDKEGNRHKERQRMKKIHRKKMEDHLHSNGEKREI